jgi:hypothetical protein
VAHPGSFLSQVLRQSTLILAVAATIGRIGVLVFVIYLNFTLFK